MKKQDILDKDLIISIDLLWFSVLAEHRGKRSERMELPAGSTVKELVNRLSGDMPVLAQFRPYLRIAVNQSYVDESNTLNQGDEVALITPVSGG